MVFIHVCSVVMLTTGKTTTTGMLAVLSYTTVTSRHMSTAIIPNVSPCSIPLLLNDKKK
jgi:hypothetical protein